MSDGDPLAPFESLFRGSARLGVLLGSLGLPWERVTPFVSSFPGEMGRYQELSVDDDGPGMGLMTRGAGKDFTFRVARFMETHGIDEPRLRRLLVTARYFEHRNLFFKVEVGPDGPEEFSWYFRRRPALDVANAWLAEAGVDHEGQERVLRVAAELRKTTVHFVAAAERPDGTSLQKLYFSQPDDDAAFDRLAAAAALCGVDDATWAPMARRRDEFAGRTMFLSVGFAAGRVLPGSKLDVHGLAPSTVTSVMEEAGRDEGASERMGLLLQMIDKETVDYAGFRLTPGQPVSTRIYGYRSES